MINEIQQHEKESMSMISLFQHIVKQKSDKKTNFVKDYMMLQ